VNFFANRFRYFPYALLLLQNKELISQNIMDTCVLNKSSSLIPVTATAATTPKKTGTGI